MAAIFEESPVVTLNPKPGFVIKTKIVAGSGHHLYHTKVFINICHDVQVPKPEGGFDPSKIFPLIVKNEWEIPIIVSPEKKSTDKKGVPSFVYDCCINSECFQWLTISADLRMIAIEWCIESVEMMHDLVLEREYAVPKMLSKGELSATEITQHDLNNSLGQKLEELQKSETAGLVQELFPDDEELPDLMNLGGKKPLIQEINELSLENKNSEKAIVSKKSSNSPININKENDPNGNGPEGSNSAGSDGSLLMQEVTTKKLHTGSKPQKIQYEFTVSQKKRGTELVVIFHSSHLTPKIQVFFQNFHLVVRNTDSTRQLGSDNELSFALPKSHMPYKCFLVKGVMSLYIYMQECHPFRDPAHTAL